MIESYFNELSLIDNEQQLTQDAAIALRDLYKEIKPYISACRIQNEDLMRLLKMAAYNREVKSLIYAFFHTPFENDIFEKHEEDYLQRSIVYEDKKPIGIATALIVDGLTLSLYGEKWNTPCLEVSENGESKCVRNAATADNFGMHLDWIESLNEIVLEECHLLPKDKKCKLASTHHGNEKLAAHAELLLKSPYVIGIINSISQQNYQRRYISKIYDNGKIDIILFWEKLKYGMAIQTTGRNRRETEKIAAILTQKYGKA